MPGLQLMELLLKLSDRMKYNVEFDIFNGTITINRFEYCLLSLGIDQGI